MKLKTRNTEDLVPERDYEQNDYNYRATSNDTLYSRGREKEVK